jgi:hypothetical protein
MAWRKAASCGGSQPGTRLRLLLLAVALGVSALFAQPGAAADESLGRILRPLEAAPWPVFLRRLELPANRSYVVVMHAPPPHPIDFRTFETALHSLAANTVNLWTRLTARTQIGHAMVAWQCATGRGFASVTGDLKDQATRMAVHDGWGATALLSTFDDGRIDGADGMPTGVAAAIATGGGNVLAVEIQEADCQRLRSFVARYVAHPARPVRRYGLLLEPGKFEGAGCMSFAIEAARRAGLFAGSGPIFRRRLDVPRSIIGWPSSVPDGVEPFAQAHSAEDRRLVSLERLMLGPWDRDAGYVRVSLIDPELVFAAVTRMRRLAGTDGDWRTHRALADTDPAVRRAAATAERWASRFKRRRIADPAGTSALVLEW